MNTFVASTLALLTVAVVTLGLAVLSLMRQVGTVLLHVAPPRPGRAGGPDARSELPLKLHDSITAASGGILVFLGAHCPACSRVEPVLATMAARYRELSIVPVVIAETQAQRDEHLASLALPGRADCQELVDAWRVPGTPFAVGIGAERRVVTSGVVNSLDQLEALAGELLHGAVADPHGDARTEESAAESLAVV